MSASTILDVAIGISFVFVLLSVIASAVTEAISAFLSLRSITLRRGIERLLKDRTLTAKIYAHPLIDGLTKDDDSDPTYIPSDLFARALIDSISNWDDEKDRSTRPSRIGLIRAILVLPTRSVRDFFRRLWPKADKPIAAPPKTTTSLDDLKKRINGAKNFEEGTRAVMVGLVGDGSIKTLEDATLAIAAWFDRSMDSVTGWYKRQVQLLIATVGVVMAVSLNVDTFFLVDNLRSESVLRETVAATVTEILKSETSAQKKAIEDTIADRKATAGATTEELFKAEEKKTAELVQQRVVAIKKGLDALTLPVGWPESGILCKEADATACDKRALPKTAWAWIRRVGGWLFTAIAIALGAPFWFDLLNKLINLRSAAPQPQKVQPKTTTTSSSSSETLADARVGRTTSSVRSEPPPPSLS